MLYLIFYYYSKVSELQKKNYLLVHYDNLLYIDSEEEFILDVNITEKAISNYNVNESNSNINNNITSAPLRVWNYIKTNKTDVYMHVMAMRNDYKIDDLSIASLQSGYVLYGVVKMIKYDNIPLSYHHRYLLSDFGYASISELDGNRYTYFFISNTIYATTTTTTAITIDMTL
jgi:hypothetical protein